jgi:hypothetical protein
LAAAAIRLGRTGQKTSQKPGKAAALLRKAAAVQISGRMKAAGPAFRPAHMGQRAPGQKIPGLILKPVHMGQRVPGQELSDIQLLRELLRDAPSRELLRGMPLREAQRRTVPDWMLSPAMN